mmetsp:Transcript_24597/g.52174  ORF Transcript_24597/g.52174 Transcript_24597/m.52174 type:complete len:526 (+) Transcript_24597:220-1797(+)
MNNDNQDTTIPENMMASDTGSGLYDLLEEAAKNATGSDDTDVSNFMLILEDEWITNVESLRKVSPVKLDELLPLLLSQELQRLLEQRDSQPLASHSNRRWRRSPLKQTRSRGMLKKPMSAGSSPKSEETAPGVAPIREDDSSASSSSSSSSDYEVLSLTRTVPPQLHQLKSHTTREVVNRKTKKANTRPSSIAQEQITLAQDAKQEQPGALVLTLAAAAQTKEFQATSKIANSKMGQFVFKMLDFFEPLCSHVCEEEGKQSSGEKMGLQSTVTKEEEGIDDDELQRMLYGNPLMVDPTERARHLIADATRKAEIIADARRKFPTREALEDAILELQARVEQQRAELEAQRKGASVLDRMEKQTIGTTAAEEELQKLYPLRLILPTAGDLEEMIEQLQHNREDAMRELDMETANIVQREIDELQRQIDGEERYLMKKRMGEVDFAADGEKTAVLSVKAKMQSGALLSCATTRDANWASRDECHKVCGSGVNKKSCKIDQKTEASVDGNNGKGSESSVSSADSRYLD